MIMKLEEVVRKIKENEDILKERFKIKSIGIFGSLAREEENVNDVDVIVEFSEPIGWEIVDLKEFLEDLLGVRVDIVTKRAAMSKPLFWKSIERRSFMSKRSPKLFVQDMLEAIEKIERYLVADG